MRNRWTVASLCMCFMLGTLGCGPGDRPPLGSINGKVAIDGQPLSGVIVTFTPESGRPGVGITDENGAYEISYTGGVKGSKVGPTTVVFMAQTGVPSSHPIPARYQSGSEFKVDVKKGRNKFDFSLESDGKPVKPASKKGIIPD